RLAHRVRAAGRDRADARGHPALLDRPGPAGTAPSRGRDTAHRRPAAGRGHDGLAGRGGARLHAADRPDAAHAVAGHRCRDGRPDRAQPGFSRRRTMKRLLPSPWLSLGIFVGWLLLARSTSAGQLILAALVAWVMPLLMAPLRPRPGPLRHWGVLCMLILRVGRDVLLSALDVSRGILRGRQHPPRGQFVNIPLDLRDPHALAALAMITTVVPGTVWS